jgi:hypothetical protein
VVAVVALVALGWVTVQASPCRRVADYLAHQQRNRAPPQHRHHPSRQRRSPRRPARPRRTTQRPHRRSHRYQTSRGNFAKDPFTDRRPPPATTTPYPPNARPAPARPRNRRPTLHKIAGWLKKSIQYQEGPANAGPRTRPTAYGHARTARDGRPMTCSRVSRAPRDAVAIAAPVEVHGRFRRSTPHRYAARPGDCDQRRHRDR